MNCKNGGNEEIMIREKDKINENLIFKKLRRETQILENSYYIFIYVILI
jgi:hypothetical protein